MSSFKNYFSCVVTSPQNTVFILVLILINKAMKTCLSLFLCQMPPLSLEVYFSDSVNEPTRSKHTSLLLLFVVTLKLQQAEKRIYSINVLGHMTLRVYITPANQQYPWTQLTCVECFFSERQNCIRTLTHYWTDVAYRDAEKLLNSTVKQKQVIR